MGGLMVTPVEAVKVGVICPHCHLILRATKTTEEGHRLCESCYKEISSKPDRTCQECGISLGATESVYLDRAMRRVILDLEVKCNYHCNGCPWEGQLKHLEYHCHKCRYQPIICPNEGCTELLTPDWMDNHVDRECQYRRVKCEHCQEEEVAMNMNEHLTTCPKYIIDCGRCQQQVYREEDHQIYSCGYFGYAVYTKVYRAYQEDFEDECHDRERTRLQEMRRVVVRCQQVPCFHIEKGCTWRGMFEQEYQEHLKECQFMTTLPEKAAVAIPDTPMVGVTQSGDKLVSFHLIEDDKLKKALSPHRDPQNGTKKDTPNERIEPMEREGAKGIGPLTPRGPEMSYQQPEMDRQQPEMDRQQPEMDRQQPEMDRQQPEMDRQQPEMDQKPINMDKTHAAQLIVSLALGGGMDKSSSQDIVSKEEAFLKLRELVRTYPEAMDLFLQSLKMKCDSMQGIREVSVGLVQDEQGEMHSTVMRESVLGPKDLSKVYKEIYEVRDEWYNIGLELNVPTEDLNHIMFTHPDNATCLREVLQMWLKRRASGEDGPTWHSLTKALRSPTIGKSILADELERKHCSPCLMGGEPDETSLSGLYDNLYAIRELWYSLGLKLGLTSATLDQIRQRSSSPKECLREVLRCWLQSDSVNRTPKTLCDALHSVTVGADQLAEELEKKYCLKSGVNEECDREEVMALLQ